MAFFRRSVFIPAIFSFVLSSTAVYAQQQPAPPATFNDEDSMRIVQEVRKNILKLTTYSVFDWITFGIHGKNVILHGYASRPILKSDAENTIKRIKGVAGVENQIEVLPNSPMDDRIRAQVYNRLYTQPALRKYNANQGSIGQAIGPGPNIAARAGGITNSPPIGFHAIHIIVKNGNVILFGAVNNQTDADIANIQANGTPGVFSVQNELQFPGQAPKSAK
jgi:osmotically-inducible protein OsmY